MTQRIVLRMRFAMLWSVFWFGSVSYSRSDETNAIQSKPIRGIGERLGRGRTIRRSSASTLQWLLQSMDDELLQPYHQSSSSSGSSSSSSSSSSGSSGSSSSSTSLLDRVLQEQSTTVCSDGTTIGYDDWEALTFDIVIAGAMESPGETYILCPNTIFNGATNINIQGIVQPWLEIYSSNVTIQCGTNGSSTNNCILRNGDIGIVTSSGMNYYQNPPTGVKLMGITFGKIHKVAIGVLGLGNEVHVEDCIFTNATHTSNDPNIGILSSQGALVTVDHCRFENNQYGSGAVGVGTLIITNSIFNHNIAYWAESLIPAFEGGNVSVFSSCFSNNTILFSPSIIFADSESTVFASDDNFGQGNQAELFGRSSSFCNGALLSATQSCLDFESPICTVLSETTTTTTTTTTSTSARMDTAQPSDKHTSLPPSVLTNAPSISSSSPSSSTTSSPSESSTGSTFNGIVGPRVGNDSSSSLSSPPSLSPVAGTTERVSDTTGESSSSYSIIGSQESTTASAAGNSFQRIRIVFFLLYSFPMVYFLLQ